MFIFKTCLKMFIRYELKEWVVSLSLQSYSHVHLVEYKDLLYFQY
jgi:hypothetical protein